MCWKYFDTAKYIEKIKLLQEAFDSHFSDFSEKDRMLAFINPFSLNDNIRFSRCQVTCKWYLLNLKQTQYWKWNLLNQNSVPIASEMIGFCRSLPCEHFPEIRKFSQSYACLFRTTYRCEESFSFMKIIKNKLRSRLSDSNLKNCQLLSCYEFNSYYWLSKSKAESKVTIKSFMFILPVYKIII